MTAHIWHAISAPEAAKILGTDPETGLGAAEALERLQKFGHNELAREDGISPLRLFINQFRNILIIILIVAIILSVAVGEIEDAIIIGVIVVFCAVLGFVQEYRAERALDALKKMLSPTITVLRDGASVEIESRNLVPGDVLLLEAGDRIPADARILESHLARTDEASLTGESNPISKIHKEVPSDAGVADRKNMLFAGTTLTYGRCRAVVTSTAMDTELGRIAREVTSVETEKTPLEKRTEEIGKWLGIIALTICALVAGISIVREMMAGRLNFQFAVTMVMFSVALAVAAVPEALAAIVTGALAIGMRQMAKNNALVRKMPAVETLGCTTVICSDKTGTLTKGEMTVRRIFTASRLIEVTGSGYAPEGGFSEPVGEAGLELLTAGLLCNDSELVKDEGGNWRVKGDPTEGALVVAAAKAGISRASALGRLPRIDELPFSSERKRMSTIHRTNDGRILAFVKGAPEIVLGLCDRVMLENGPVPLDDEHARKVLGVAEEMAGQALRVLGVAVRELSADTGFDESTVETHLTFLGLTGMMDPPREEAVEAVRVCRKVGIRPVMITGDHMVTAVAVAGEIGIYHDGDRVLNGRDLEKLSDGEFESIVAEVTVYARVSPIDKLRIVRAWKKRGEVVAMTGDGVNDAPALKQADIGVAMGITGTDVAKEAADMVLTDDNFATIVKAIERGRWIYDNIKKYLTYLLRCNITEVAVIGGVVLILGPKYLPLLPAAILYINLATDGLPALALGVAPPDPDIMERPPRDPKESVFSKDVVAFISLALLIEIPFFFWLFFHDLNNITEARTEMFFLFIIVEIIIALNFRSMRYSVLKAPPHPWLLLAIIWEIALVAFLIQFPTLRESFGIEMPKWSTLVMITGFGLIVGLSMEVVKAFLRRSDKTTENA